MTAARRLFELVLSGEVRDEDLPEVPEEARPFLRQALRDVQARTDEADRKGGRLAGTSSASFWADAEEPSPSGRVVYLLKGRLIEVIAIHADHDEAYRRARKRYRRT